MQPQTAISDWLKKQHVLSYCVADDGGLWCANAFYLYDAHQVACYLLSQRQTRHGQMAGECCQVAGTVSGQPKSVALIRGVQFRGELRLLCEPPCMADAHGDYVHGNYAHDDYAHGDYAHLLQRFCQRFPAARLLSAPLWQIRFDEIKFTDNRLGFGKKLIWQRQAAASGFNTET